MNNVLNIKTAIDKKDLEAFSQALLEQNVKLQIENQQLKEKVEHLEELLKHVPMGKTNSGIVVPEGYAMGTVSGASPKTNNITGFGIIGAAPSSKDVDDLIWSDRDIPQDTLDEWTWERESD